MYIILLYKSIIIVVRMDKMTEQTFKITADTGVHARHATLNINKTDQNESEVEMSYNDKTVNLKSIKGVMYLGIPKDAEIKHTAEGSDEEEEMKGIAEVIKENLGE